MKQKRTKRYGGFLVGDKVLVKGKYYEWLKEGEITGLVDGYCSVYFTENTKMLGEPVVFAFMPNQLINLTRQEEEARKRVITFSPSDLPKEEESLTKLYDQLCTNIDVWCDTLKRQLKERIDEFKSSL